MREQVGDKEYVITVDYLWQSYRGEPHPIVFRDYDILTVQAKENELREALVNVKQIIEAQIARGDSSEEFYEL